jgi:hypothetical protein
MDAVDVSKIVQVKIGGVLERLMDDLVPEIRPLIEQSPDIQALPDGEVRTGTATLVAAKTVATMVITSVLTQLRLRGQFHDAALDQVLREAQDAERRNAGELS